MNNNKLSPRKQQILRAIVDAHIMHGEPVGSKFLSQDIRISASPATIRNEMAELEDMGYLLQPHTSAGRVPSELGYRFYVDALVKQYGETKSEIADINEQLRYKLTEMDEILEEASHLASYLSDYTGIAFKTGGCKVRITRFDTVYISPHMFHLVISFSGEIVKSKTFSQGFTITREELSRFTDALNIYLVNLVPDEITMPITMKLESIMGHAAAIVHPVIKAICEAMQELDSADVRVEGVNKLLNYPEYSDVSRLRGVLDVLEEKDKLIDVISQRSLSPEGINVYIGNESEGSAMGNTTLIFKNVNVGGGTVAIGVIGPRRMNYQKVIGALNRISDEIDKMFGDDSSLLGDGGDDED